MPRLFTGIEIPPEIREEIARLKHPLPGGSRWTEPDNLHLTLRFVGDIEPPQAQEFSDNLESIDLDAFELRLSGLGVFGGNEPRSIWAGVEDSAPLEALARANDRAARSAGLPPDGRAFKAHVTLARLKYASSDDIARVLQRLGAFRTRPFIVSRFVLYSAKPNTGGGPYAIEEAFNLRGGEYATDLDLDYSW
ncbi:RNA 2',3'-cyclic phosphodiesterase [Hyphomicrobium sp. D-2]|uniref:RNA 2',3'-cyclic phosphodiesterase n=1 Tax=Hyphomicrobium sp. D-2 TaxID=3041621 RepID=UPI002458D39D|nr:RNA 2',3'-cyclic phosphodiesterase [Hyphomicrobium sp. D-2]MDH4983379.1 RNA 2',3'-cyclic phosphodiesterase [Hyphomicrobium sp. D-2]